MEQTHTLIIGASISGLASAVSLQKQGIDHLMIEKQDQVAAPWRNHYHRLHLHTNKRVSHLPYKKFSTTVSTYPTRQQVVDYLEAYQKEFNVNPIFNTEARSVKKEGAYWLTQTNNGTYKSKYLILATGPFNKPRSFHFAGMESFPGKILHSYHYKTGGDFKGQHVLVVGFGNSACEIAIDLHEQGAIPAMAVRSPVNVIPRDLLGIPILEISQLMSRLPPRVADTINAPLMRLLFGDLAKLGLKKMPYGPFEEIKRDGNIPVLDIGTIKHIRDGHIKIYDNIDRIAGKTVHFANGKKADFDAIVAAVGYCRGCEEMIEVDKSRFQELNVSIDQQKNFGKDGLYFCGFYVGPRGQIREIALDAQKIAKDIAKKESLLTV
jgi:hypothetical protein